MTTFTFLLLIVKVVYPIYGCDDYLLLDKLGCIPYPSVI